MWFGAFPGKGFSGFVSGTETAMDRNLKNEMGFNEIEAGQIRNAGTRMGLEHDLIRRPGMNSMALAWSLGMQRNAPGDIERAWQSRMGRQLTEYQTMREMYPFLEIFTHPYVGTMPDPGLYDTSQTQARQLPPVMPKDISQAQSGPTPIERWRDLFPYPPYDPYQGGAGYGQGAWGSYGQGRGDYQPPSGAVPTYQDPFTGRPQVGDPYTDPYNAYPYPFYGRYR